MPFPTVRGKTFQEWGEQFVEALEPLVATLPKENQEKLAEASAALFMQIERVSTQLYNDVQALMMDRGDPDDPSQKPIP
jgi:hypothetical protein